MFRMIWKEWSNRWLVKLEIFKGNWEKRNKDYRKLRGTLKEH
jgi:hypothetical protein